MVSDYLNVVLLIFLKSGSLPVPISPDKQGCTVQRNEQIHNNNYVEKHMDSD